jgi:hypothetical protein
MANKFQGIITCQLVTACMQAGGGGMNGSITVREGRNPLLGKGFALYGSDSGIRLVEWASPVEDKANR